MAGFLFFNVSGRSRTVRNIAVAAATAGVANKLGYTDLSGTNASFADKLGNNLIYAGTAAAVETAVNGGSLKDGLEAQILAALVNTAHGEVASEIKGLDKHYLAHKLAHAVAGCAAAAANKGKCQDGAIGAAVGEIVAEAYGKPDKDLSAKEYQLQTEKLIAITKVVSGSVSALLGGDFERTANIAENTVLNNFLNPEQDVVIKKDLADCAGKHSGNMVALLSCQGQVVKRSHGQSEQNDRELEAAYAAARNGNPTELERLKKKYAAAISPQGMLQLKALLKKQYPKANEARITELANQSIEQFKLDWHLAQSRVAAVAPTEFVNKAAGLTVEIAGAALTIKELYGLRSLKVTNGSTIILQNLDRKVVQSRINIPNGDISSGWKHVQRRHFSGTGSQFTISQTELKTILQRDVVKIPVSSTRKSIKGNQAITLYERVVKFNKPIGLDKYQGNTPTKFMTVLTDKHGNLITATPGKLK